MNAIRVSTHFVKLVTLFFITKYARLQESSEHHMPHVAERLFVVIAS